MGKLRLVPIVVALGALSAAACDTSYSSSASDDGGHDASTSNDGGRSTADGSSTGDASKDGASIDAAADTGTIDGAADTGAGCTADTQSDAMNCGTCGHVCNVGGCVGGECQHVVFVAIPANGPKLGGLTGADALCQSTATNAGLHGNFLAWLGTSAASPATRFFKGTRAYVLHDGTVVSPSWTELTGGSLLHAIDEAADGLPSTTNQTWTSVADDGTYAPLDGNACANWTSTSQGDRSPWGNAAGMGGGWTNSSSDSCNTPGHGIYCFEQ